MAREENFLDTWTPRALAVLRLITGYLYLQHGTAKLLRVPHVPMFDQLRLLSLDGFAGMLEIVGSVLILLGLFTRPVAFILSGEMAVAYFLVHALQGNFFMPTLNQGELAVLYCFIFLFLARLAGDPGVSIRSLLASAWPQLPSHNGTTGSRFAARGLRCGSGKTRGAEPHTNGSRQ